MVKGYVHIIYVLDGEGNEGKKWREMTSNNWPEKGIFEYHWKMRRRKKVLERTGRNLKV